jgi:hypothetical protein
MGRYLFTLILASLLISPAPVSAAGAQTGPEVPRLFGVFAPKLGAWSEYAIFDKATGKRTVMRMSIVGVEGDSFWYEVVNREGEGSSIVKMLVKGDPGDSGNIERLIIKSGPDPAQEMGTDSLPAGRRLASHMFEQRSGMPTSPGVHLKKVNSGDGTATVPAGTFSVSMHDIVDETGTVYASYKSSQNIRPFGVVASDTADTTMVLTGHGTGAKSLITEDPTMMNRPPQMMEGMAPEPGMKPAPGNTLIRQIPGMGTGYEPR